uniref:Calponin-1 n=1 Tax=Junco hyemalis TaxID=40217 RepID=A0A8C5JNW9_JUNHY
MSLLSPRAHPVAFQQLENIGNFLRAITRYGVKPHDIFEANDLFENTNHTQVQSTLIALASQVRSSGHRGTPTHPLTPLPIFEPALGMEHCDTMTIGLQMGSNKGASQTGMTVYGLPRQVYDPKYCGGPELLGLDGCDGLYNSQ